MDQVTKLLKNITSEDEKKLKDEIFIYYLLQSLERTSTRNIKAIETILKKYDIKYINDLLPADAGGGSK